MPPSRTSPDFSLPYWLDRDRPVFATLDEDKSTDAVIIGAGIAGLKLARCLSRYGIKSIVLEGIRVGEGASGRNQGTINHSPNMTYDGCIRRHSREVARQLWRLGLENHRLLREQIDEYAIDCDYAVSGMTFLARCDVEGWEEQLAAYHRDAELLREDGFAAHCLDEIEARRVGGNDVFAGGLTYTSDAQFHSGKFVMGLAQGVAKLPGVQIFEGVRVHGIDRIGAAIRLRTTNHVVEAPLVFLATNALVPQYVPGLQAALRAERGQVIVTEPLASRPCTGSFGTALAWWREIRESDGRYRLLFGGARKRDEADSLFPQYLPDGRPNSQLEAGGFRPSAEHQRRLDAQFDALFPQLSGVQITHRWGGLQSFTADDLPVIGPFDEELRIWGMAGFCGRGNCHSDAGAEYLAGKVAGAASDVERRFGSLFDLMRPFRESANWRPWSSVAENSLPCQRGH